MPNARGLNRLQRAGRPARQRNTPARRQQPPHAAPNHHEHLGHHRIAGRRRRVEVEPARREFGEDAVQNQGVEVDVEAPIVMRP